jgi:hypothetical protein
VKCARDGCENPAAPYSGKGQRPIYCGRACRYKVYELTPEGQAARKRAVVKLRRKYRADGVCVDCGVALGARSKVYCDTHLDARNRRATEKRRTRCRAGQPT